MMTNQLSALKTKYSQWIELDCLYENTGRRPVFIYSSYLLTSEEFYRRIVIIAAIATTSAGTVVAITVAPGVPVGAS
jgi:hypothetical protein